MGEALYRKHRSKSLDEIVGQEHITTTLSNAIKSGKISHAYLLTGPKGVGKTSVARILAHAVNELDYQPDAGPKYIDIIEIDAASNRRIDEIRELREKVQTAPTSSKYKVYIIDEVHMLTREAFNALLKTLEEPPAHAIFILATTEAHKLPETIISRTQHFSFKPISSEDLISHLAQIAKTEKIDIDDEALKVIASYGRGSFRDSISLLDQLSSSGSKITAKDVQEAVGIAPSEIISSIINSISAHDQKSLLTTIDDIESQNLDTAIVASSLIESLLQSVRNNNNNLSKKTLLWLVNELTSVQKSPNPDIRLEIILLEAVWGEQVNTKPKTPEAQSAPINEATPKTEAKIEKPVQKPAESVQKPAQKTDDLWTRVIAMLKGKHNTLYGVARMANPEIGKDRIKLIFKHDFHKRRCGEPRNKKILQDTLQELSGQSFEIEFITDKSAPTPKLETQEPKPSDTLDTITNVFGGGEVLED
ncbi:MAG TPA: DNA polymerase III subunit gamma/tau [Candidatus Saccharibacteria bacterium]|nr:DNA polymerase III subunit gamma/tau [Candidatus Saccharibacteria bacterium]